MAKTISQMIRATEADTSDLFMISKEDSSVDTGYISRAVSLTTVANEMLNNLEFTTQLETENKQVILAINELNAKINGIDVLIGEGIS